jgi:hypothetical protein
MKSTRVFIVSGSLMLLFLAVNTLHAQTDLNTRKALYFTGTKTDSIDLKNDVYVANGATLNLSAELRVSCEQNECVFNVGIIATRTGTGALSTEVVVQVAKSGEKFTKTVEFGANEKFKQVVLPVKLNLGKNQLSITIDPGKSTPETDEINNSFSATVMVNWKRANPGDKN